MYGRMIGEHQGIGFQSHSRSVDRPSYKKRHSYVEKKGYINVRNGTYMLQSK